MMKMNNKSNSIELNTSNLQNNQRKDSLKSLNQKIKDSKNFFSRKFFKDLGIVESVSNGIINVLGLQKAANGENNIKNLIYDYKQYLIKIKEKFIVINEVFDIMINKNFFLKYELDVIDNNISYNSLIKKEQYKENKYILLMHKLGNTGFNSLKKSRSNPEFTVIKEKSVIINNIIFKGGPFPNGNVVLPVSPRNQNKDKKVEIDNNDKEEIFENVDKKEVLKSNIELNKLLKNSNKKNLIYDERINKNSDFLLKKSNSNNDVSLIKNKVKGVDEIQLKEDSVVINNGSSFNMKNMQLAFSNNFNKNSDLYNIYNSVELPRTQQYGYTIYRKFDVKKFTKDNKKNIEKIINDELIEVERGSSLYNKEELEVNDSIKYTTEQLNIKKDMLTAILKSLKHIVLIDRIKAENGEVTYMYHVVTTNPLTVNYGGPNKFEPIFLFYDEKKKKDFYIAPIRLYNTVTEKEYLEIVKVQTKDDFDFQSKIVNKIIELQKSSSSKIEFYEMHIKNDCLLKKIEDIEPTSMFRKINSEHEITPLVEKLVTDIMVISKANN